MTLSDQEFDEMLHGLYIIINQSIETHTGDEFRLRDIKLWLSGIDTKLEVELAKFAPKPPKQESDGVSSQSDLDEIPF